MNGTPRSDRLESWKEIAAYLGRSTRTVQRWERTEGLPVHRLVHEKLGSVYAFGPELDAWWAERSSRLSASDAAADSGEADVPELAETEAAPAEAPAPARRSFRTRPRVALAGVVACAAALGGFAIWRWTRVADGPATPLRIAVLPFDNLTGDVDQEYLSDGMTEEMIGVLGRLNRRLAVIARASVMRYKRTDRKLAEIARELEVGYLLLGSVRREGQRVRISAQLVRAPEDTPLWSQTFDRGLGDLLGMQSELARRIASEVRIQLAPETEARLRQTPRRDPEAHLAYLRGRHQLSQRTPDSLRAALQAFESAVARDPQHAPAWSGLSDAYSLLANWGLLPVAEAMPKAKAAAGRALELDEGLAEAHASLAFLLRNADWDFPGAEREFRRALELNPSYEQAHTWYALFLRSLGRFEEAATVLERARDLDPLSLRPRGQLAGLAFDAGRYQEAVALVRQILDADPNEFGAQVDLARGLSQLGAHAEAITTALRAVEMSGEHPMTLAALGCAYASAGRKDEARATLRRLEAMAERRHVVSYYFAVVYASLGENDAAMRWLERVYAEHHVGILSLGIEPEFASLHGDPRFVELMRRVGLPPPPPRPHGAARPRAARSPA